MGSAAMCTLGLHIFAVAAFGLCTAQKNVPETNHKLAGTGVVNKQKRLGHVEARADHVEAKGANVEARGGDIEVGVTNVEARVGRV